MVRPEATMISPTPERYYSLSGDTKMAGYETEENSATTSHSGNLLSDRKVRRVEKSTSFTSDDEFSEPYIMDGIDEVCESGDIDDVPRRKGARKPRPASWCGATQFLRNEDAADFDPERFKQLQESLKQADLEREVILSCLGKEYIERVTLQSHLQSICSKFGYHLEDLILQKNEKTDSKQDKTNPEIKDNPADRVNKLSKISENKVHSFQDDTVLGMKDKTSVHNGINGVDGDSNTNSGRLESFRQTKDTVIEIAEAEQRKSTMNFSHAFSKKTFQQSNKDRATLAHSTEGKSTTKATHNEILKESKKSPARADTDSRLMVGLGSNLNMGNGTKEITVIDQSPSSKNNKQVFVDSKQSKGQVNYADIGNTDSHSINFARHEESVYPSLDLHKKLAGENKVVSIEKSSNSVNHAKSLNMAASKTKQKTFSVLELERTMKSNTTSSMASADESIIELKDFLTELIEENQKAAKRIVLLEKRMSKDGAKTQGESNASDTLYTYRRPPYSKRRSYTTDDVHESVSYNGRVIPTHKRRSSFSEDRSSSASSTANRLLRTTLSSQQKMKPKLQRKQSRSSDCLTTMSVDSADSDDSRKTYKEREGRTVARNSPDVNEIVVTNDENMKTVFCQASYDSNTFQYIYTIDAEMSNKEYNKLLSIINMLQEQRRKWENEVRELQTKVEVLGKDKIEVVQNNKLLRDSLEDANKAIREINSKVQELKQTIVPLREDNAKLREQNQSWRLKFENFRKDKIKLVQEIQDLKKLRVKLEDKITNYEAREEMRKMHKITEERFMEEKEHREFHSNDVGEKKKESMKRTNTAVRTDVSSNKSIESQSTSKATSVSDTLVETNNDADEELVTYQLRSKQEEGDIYSSTSKVENYPRNEKKDIVYTDEQDRQSRSQILQSEKRHVKQVEHVTEEINRVNDNIERRGSVTDRNILSEKKVVKLTDTGIDKTDAGEQISTHLRDSQQTLKDKEEVSKTDSENKNYEEEYNRSVSQKIQLIEQKQKNVQIEHKNVQNISVTVRAKSVSPNPAPKDDDSKRLRDIEAQNASLMSELLNLKNRLLVYEETVSSNQQAAIADRERELRHEREIIAKEQEQLLESSDGTVKKQLEREEQTLLRELSQRSPKPDKEAMTGSQSTEDVRKNQEALARSIKRRSLEIGSSSHTRMKADKTQDTQEEPVPSPWAHSLHQIGNDMSRWASFSQDSLLEVKEVSKMSHADREEARIRVSKQVTDTDLQRRDLIKQKKAQYTAVTRSLSPSQVKLGGTISSENQSSIGSGRVQFSTNSQVAMISGSLQRDSENPKYRTEITLKRVSSQESHLDDSSSKQSEAKIKSDQTGHSNAGYIEDEHVAKTDVRGSVKFFESFQTDEKRVHYDEQYKERHDSLTDREVQEINEGVNRRAERSHVKVKQVPKESESVSYRERTDKNHTRQDRMENTQDRGSKTTISVNSQRKHVDITQGGAFRGQERETAETKNRHDVSSHPRTAQELQHLQGHRRVEKETNERESFHFYDERHHSNVKKASSFKGQSSVGEREVTFATDQVSSNSNSHNLSKRENKQNVMKENRHEVQGNSYEQHGKTNKGIIGRTEELFETVTQKSSHGNVIKQQHSQRHVTTKDIYDHADETEKLSERGAVQREHLRVNGHTNREMAASRHYNGGKYISDARNEAFSTDSLNVTDGTNDREARRTATTTTIKREEEYVNSKTLERQHSEKGYHSRGRSPATVLYLDELTQINDTAVTLPRSRRTRSLRMRPKSETYGARNNSEAAVGVKQQTTSSSFQRIGSVRTRKELEKERKRRENMSLSLSESNLLTGKNSNGVVRRSVRHHIYDDKQHSEVHISDSESKGRLHYHSQEFLKVDVPGINNVESGYYHDVHCESGCLTLPRSPKSPKTSRKFNCEMCKEMSKRKQNTEQKYCREKYFPIAHTDFV